MERLAWILVWSLLAGPATAADAAGESGDAAPASNTAAASEAVEPAVQPSDDEEPPPANDGAPSPDVFVPSEEISEDLSIAFPVDI